MNSIESAVDGDFLIESDSSDTVVEVVLTLESVSERADNCMDGTSDSDHGTNEAVYQKRMIRCSISIGR
jgi:hypothetical protein